MARRIRALARHGSAAALALAVCGAGTAAALAQDASDGRFQIERVGEDLLRLDRATGLVELCVVATPTFVCREVVAAAPPLEEGTASPASGEILSENQALKLENARLKRRLAMIAALVADSAEPEALPTTLRAVLPLDARREIDEALDVTTYAVRRFSDLFKSLTEDDKAAN